MKYLFLPVLLFLGGCQIGYYGHITRGHLSLMADRQPVTEVLKTGALTGHQRQQLLLSQQLLTFAGQRLDLPVKKVYRDYVSLPEDWVVWNLFAAPEFSLEPHLWCYPLIGCAGYRGYFSVSRAEREQHRLEGKGLQVYGAGAIAYSTLGWFRDPITSAMLQGDDLWLAELLFHELVHRRFYLKGDTRFNESLATAVAREGVRRWLAAEGDPALAAVLLERDQARQAFLTLVADAREELEQLYRAGLPPAEMRQEREKIIAGLRRRYDEARQTLPALAGYADWFAGPLNNAQLNMVSDYHDQVPLFDAALLRCGGDWRCFWGEVEKLAKLPAAERALLNRNLHD